ncbi:MAG: hypothetical protein KDD50_10280 [Bdellovibrionales bacterium]|nr:hypothetical protein [Bdellovibrionales bacterium]
MKHKIFGLLIILFCTAGQAAVVDPSLDFVIHQDYTSIRALGMGNAFAAVADDHSAIFYNPAALARRKEGVVTGTLGGGVSNDYFTLLKDIQDASSQSGSNGITQITNLLQENYGKNFYANFKWSGMWAMPGWGMAFLPINLTSSFTPHYQGAPSLNVTAYIDTTAAYSWADNFNWMGKKDKFSFGFTTKMVHRIFFSDTLNALTLSQGGEVFDQSRAAEGLTFDIDVGTLWTPYISKDSFFSFLEYAKPNFALVVRNLLDIGYVSNLHLIDPHSNEPTKLNRRIDLGSDWRLPKFWKFDPHFAFDIREILHPNWSFKKGVHLGAELYWTMYDWWKGSWSIGLNQGYPSFGFGARFTLFKLDLAYFGEEAGTADTPIESKRFMLDASLEF